MSARILVVDDSPTVQKVVAITLANEGYELFQALNEDELYGKIKTGAFDLILLDFTISPKKSGYETIKQVLAQAPQAPILLLLGQFDQVDEQILAKIGVQEKLIKPFDSARFIQRCRALLEGKPLEVKPAPKLEMDLDLPASNVEENWTHNSPKPEMTKPKLPESRPSEFKTPNALKTEIESWGVPVPAVIGEQAANVIEFPPVIDEEEHHPQAHQEVSFEETSLPAGEDLSYPDQNDVSVAALTEATLSSRLIPMNDLAPESDDRGFTDEQTERLNLPADLSHNLENEIQEDSAEDFWMTDIETSDDSKPETKTPVVSVSSVDLELHEEKQVEQVVAPQIDKDELIEKVRASMPELNQEEILSKLREALPPIVEQYMKDYCEKTVERVAWEIIPDLAENLIRRELRAIAESVPRDS